MFTHYPYIIDTSNFCGLLFGPTLAYSNVSILCSVPLSHISPSFTCLSFFLIINMCCCLAFHLSCMLLFFFIIVMCTAVLHFIFIVCLCFSLFALHLSMVHTHMFLPPLQYPHAGLCDNCVGHCFLSMSLPLLSHISFHPCLLQFCLFVSSFPSLSIHDPVLALLSHFVLLSPPF